MKTRDAILSMLSKGGKITSEEIESSLSLTRQAAHYHLDRLARENKIIKVGKTKGSYYILNDKNAIAKTLGEEIKKEEALINRNLHEDSVFNKIRTTSPLLSNLDQDTINIIEYAFTEMLNNAIEHSQSEKILYSIARRGRLIEFTVKDWGIGVFNNIKTKLGLANELEAVQELVKGKLTTDPQRHTGEGIFFTSKIADKFSLKSSKLELLFDNVIEDVFVKEERRHGGTIAHFSISADSGKKLEAVFKEYSSESFVFDKSRVSIKLFTGETEYISRSQARRLLTNMDKFGKIILDFKGINTIGQGFADQIFRIFKNEHPQIEIEAVNCSDTVSMMIKHVLG